jgi:hypothetical protein
MVVSRGTRFNGKAFTIAALLVVGVGFTLLWTQVGGGGQPAAIQEAAIPTAAMQPSMAKRFTISPPLTRSTHLLQPMVRGRNMRVAAAAEAPVAEDIAVRQKEVSEWIANWKSGGSSAGAADPAALKLESMKAPGQADLKEKFEMRKGLDIQLAQFRVEAIRDISAEGANVPKGTLGTMEARLVAWDNGMYSTDMGRGIDWAINKQLTSENNAKTMADIAAAAIESAGTASEKKAAFKAQRKADAAAAVAAKAEARADGAAKFAASQAQQDLANTAKQADAETKAKVGEMAAAVGWRAEDMPGVTAPMGFFDPLGFATDCPQGKMLFYREVELKHGRLGMLASLGILVGEKFHPLFGGDIDSPAYVAFQETPLQTFWPAVVFAIAIPEMYSVFTFERPEDGFWEMKSDRRAGDFNWDPLGMRPTNQKELDELQTKELNNGRLAMIAAAGMIAQELVSGEKIFT